MGVLVDLSGSKGMRPTCVTRGCQWGALGLLISSGCSSSQLCVLQLAEAAWFDRHTLKQAVQEARYMSTQPLDTRSTIPPELGFFIPPPTAIAFSLIEAWLDESRVSRL
jgi:hypothetical protein